MVHFHVFTVVSLHLYVVHDDPGVIFSNGDVHCIGCVPIGQTGFVVDRVSLSLLGLGFVSLQYCFGQVKLEDLDAAFATVVFIESSSMVATLDTSSS